MDSLNFGFLKRHNEQLATLGGLAESYFPSDPSTAIVKLHQFAKLMAKLIAAHHAVYRDERETFEETLRRLSYDRLIPREVADIFHTLRKAGNCAVHEATGDHSTALTILKFAQELDTERATVASSLAALQAEAETVPRAEAAQLVELGKKLLPGSISMRPRHAP